MCRSEINATQSKHGLSGSHNILLFKCAACAAYQWKEKNVHCVDPAKIPVEHFASYLLATIMFPPLFCWAQFPCRQCCAVKYQFNSQTHIPRNIQIRKPPSSLRRIYLPRPPIPILLLFFASKLMISPNRARRPRGHVR